ncbi:MAG: sterol desaturase family protein [Pyrinomonadaceae bacterium]|nr:sterol desaturase family protein [Pyrinomonadaceae bacterium]
MDRVVGQVVGFVVLLAVFTTLERAFALHKEQSVFRKGWRTDVAHFFLNRFLIDAGSFVVVVILAILLRWAVNGELQNFVAGQPWIVQFLEAVLIVNVVGYFAHRLSHTIPFLWKFHAIHHSSENLDWLAAARVHPVDQIISRAMMFVPLYVLGFSKEVFGAYVFFALLHAIFIHSNVRFRFKFLRGIITTPEYHRWHHSNHPEARNKNFAGELPLIDKIFGTYYLPEDNNAKKYGTDEPVPQGYFSQMKYPFRKTAI